MTDFNEIKSHLSQKIDKLDQFIQIEERQDFLITDYKGQSFIIIDVPVNADSYIINLNGKDIPVSEFDETKTFNISNATIIGFIPIDGESGFLGYGDSHCDFVFFDKSELCFVEFKLNATSIRKVDKNRCKAIGQLGNTINYFDEKLDKDYLGLNLKAYVCTPEFYPRDDAAWKSLAIEFLENYDIRLFESNHKICK